MGTDRRTGGRGRGGRNEEVRVLNEWATPFLPRLDHGQVRATFPSSVGWCVCHKGCLGRGEGRGRADGGGDTGKLGQSSLSGSGRCARGYPLPGASEDNYQEDGGRQVRLGEIACAGHCPDWRPGRPSPSFGGLEDRRPRGPTYLRCHVGRFLAVREPRSSGSERQGGTDDLVATGRCSPGGAGSGLGHCPWRSAAGGGGGRGQRPARSRGSSASSAPVSPASPARPACPAAEHLPPPGRAVRLSTAAGLDFSGRESVNSSPALSPPPIGGRTNPRRPGPVGVASALQPQLWAEPPPERLWAERP